MPATLIALRRGEHLAAVDRKVLAEHHRPLAGLVEQRLEDALPLGERGGGDVEAVEMEEVEDVVDEPVLPPVGEVRGERRRVAPARAVLDDDDAVKDDAVDGEAPDRLGDARHAAGRRVAGGIVEGEPPRLALRLDPRALEQDLVDEPRAARRRLPGARHARRHEARDRRGPRAGHHAGEEAGRRPPLLRHHLEPPAFARHPCLRLRRSEPIRGRPGRMARAPGILSEGSPRRAMDRSSVGPRRNAEGGGR